MVVLMSTTCRGCRVAQTLPCPRHPQLSSPDYLLRFDGTATICTVVLDDAKTFNSIKEAQAYYDAALKQGVRCTTLKPVRLTPNRSK